MAETPEITEHHLNFLRSRGYQVKNIKAVEKFVAGMKDEERAAFMADAEKWTEPEPGKASAAAADIPDEGKASSDSREGREAKQFKVLRHLTHNEKHHKPGETVSEEHFTPEQVKALLDTQTMEEVVEEEEDEEEKK